MRQPSVAKPTSGKTTSALGTSSPAKTSARPETLDLGNLTDLIEEESVAAAPAMPGKAVARGAMPPPAPKKDTTGIFLLEAGMTKGQRVRSLGIGIAASLALLGGLGWLMVSTGGLNLIVPEAQRKAGEDGGSGWFNLKLGSGGGGGGGGAALPELDAADRKKQQDEEAARRAAARKAAAAKAAQQQGEDAESAAPKIAQPEEPKTARERALAGLRTPGGGGADLDDGASGDAKAPGALGRGPLGKSDLLAQHASKFKVDASGALKMKSVSQRDGPTIGRVVSANQPRLRSCYERQLRRDPNLKGRIDVSFVIEGSGRVKNVKVNARQFDNAIVTNCMKQVVESWNFGPSDAGDTQYQFPITLSSTF